ncbi:MAG: hypothetical protein ACF8PN_05740 [Phycisphaerales bacterium]
MSEFWRALLDLQQIPVDAQNITVGWERPFPAWIWALAIFLPGLYAFWSYSGLTGRRVTRGALAGARFLLLFGLAILLAGPTLIVPRERIERDWVVMLLDRSESLRIEDRVDPDTGERLSRDAQLRRALETLDPSVASIAADHNILWLGFDVGAYELSAGENGALELDDPSGQRTSIGSALAQTTRRLAARPISGIVLFSDGRTTDPPDRGVLRRLQAEAAPVFTVPLGSPDPIGDFAIDRITAPDRAFTHDRVPVDVRIDRVGSAGDALGGLTVELVDAATGETLDTRRVEPGEDLDQVTLVAEPSGEGERRWLVRVDPDDPDLVELNNEREMLVDLVDRPLRLLYIEGYPRWEYRWLKDLLLRERSVDLSVYLVSADRDFAQEGDSPITRLPNSPEEFEPYDVIVLGDVPASYFTPRQLEMMRDHVADRGAGLLWIAGPRANPQSYTGTALAGLAPIRLLGALPAIGESITIEPTPLAERLGVLRLMQGDQSAWSFLADPQTGWNTLRWAWRIDPSLLKPTAEPIAVTAQTFGADGEALPVIINLRYGAGRSILVATDEIWRWRFGQGDYLPEQLWLQLVRLLGRDRLAHAGRDAVLNVTPRRVELDQPVIVEVDVRDAALLDRALSSMGALLVDDEGVETPLELTPSSEDPARFTTTVTLDRPGEWRVRVDDPALRGLELAAPISVARPDDELRQPQTDHEGLAQLSDLTGGRVLTPDDFAELPDMLPNRSVRTPMDITEPLWDTPLCLAIFVILLTIEWIGRKFIRLV